jgi:hypothetical protein
MAQRLVHVFAARAKVRLSRIQLNGASGGHTRASNNVDSHK